VKDGQGLDSRIARTRSWAREWSGAWRLLGYLTAAAGLLLTWYLFVSVIVPYALVGNDGVTYLAAAERLNAGHQLYSLELGDRLVYGLGSPCCPFPLMSPPPIAVLWRPLALLGPEAALLLWDWVNAAAIIVTVGLLLIRRPLTTGILIVVLSLPLAVETLLGNVNGLLLAGIGATWLLGRSGKYTSAGAVIGLMAAVKIWPALLIVWFISQRKFGAATGFVVSLVVVGVMSLLGAGITAHVEYLTTVAPATSGLASLAELVRAATGIWIPWVAYAVLVFGVLEVWALRARPRLAWAAAVLAMVFGAPVFHAGTLVLLFGALVPWADPAPAPVDLIERDDDPSRPTTDVVEPRV
jgi:hypothetical protein